LQVESFFSFHREAFEQALIFYIRKRWHLFNNCYKIIFTIILITAVKNLQQPFVYGRIIMNRP